jgi:rhodanese-related sulfurtransferase
MPDSTLTDLASALDSCATVIDVREPAEYVSGHVPGAVLIPMSRLTTRLDELDRTGPVHVVCASGGRSSAMAEYLVRTGFDARSVVGGTDAWAASGRPLVTGTTPR